MKFRLIRQAYTRAQVHGHIPIGDTYYILQVKPNTPHDSESGEDWQTVPVVNWDDLYDDEKKAIEKELS